MERRKDAGDRLPYCSLCSRPSVIRCRDPDRHLCAEHFCQDLTGRVLKTVTTSAMITEGDRIAVAFSGGKDSTALLLVLQEILPLWQDVSLVAITIDEGIAGYRNETLQCAERLVRELGMEHRIVPFSRLFHTDLDAILQGREERACSICGILRRRALSSAAEEAGTTKIATGHNLDDEAQAVLMNVFRGDLVRFVRDSSSPSGRCFIPRIKPLREISEKEIAVYLMVRGYYSRLPECPYTRYALRAEVRASLSALEFRHPGTMRNLVTGKQRLATLLAEVLRGREIATCRECGEPCSGTICQTCDLLKKIFR